jgi:putative hydrolase of the HAD superfamily
MRPRVVALDLGGVLVDVDRGRLPALLGAATEAIEEAFFGGSLHDDVSTGVVDGEAFIAEAARRLGAPAPRVRAAWEAFIEVSPGALDVVRTLPVPAVPWTNTDPVHFAKLGRGLPSLCAAPARGTSYELGAMKPAAAFYALALARLGAEPGGVLFLDDRADNVAAARALGVDARVVRGVDGARAALREAFDLA